MAKRLPKNVVFKGDNGKYMAAVSPPGTDHVYLQFYAEDALNPRCRHIIEYINECDDIIRIKSGFYNKYWRLSPAWIWVDSSDTTKNNRDTLFRLVKLSEGKYALKNLGNGNYCHRLTYDYKQDCLNASTDNIWREAHLTVEEAVSERRIFDVEYHTLKANVLGRKVITLTNKELVNHSSQDDKMKLTLKYTLTKEKKWDSSASMKVGIKATFEAGVPAVASEKIEIESEFSASYTWGESLQTTEEHSTEYEVIVPARTKSKVSVVVTEAICEVPFSYTQEDSLTTGDKLITKFNDGIYRGVNSYDMKIEHSHEEKI